MSDTGGLGAGGQGASPEGSELLAAARSWADSSGLTRQIEQSPLLMLAGALATGYILGSVLPAGGGTGMARHGLMAGVSQAMGEAMGGAPRRMSTADFANRHIGQGGRQL